LVEITESKPLGSRCRLKLNKLMEEIVLESIVRRPINHREFENIIVSPRLHRGRERESADVKVVEINRVLIPKDEDPPTGAKGRLLGKALET
jgi:hypothetical protein